MNACSMSTLGYDIFDVNTQVRHVYTMSNICLSNRRDLATVEAYIDKGGTMASSATTNDPKDGSSEGQVVEMPDATPGRDGRPNASGSF